MEDTNVIISVIVPLFNEENNVISIFENLLTQKFKNFELIFINDGSKDDTENIILENMKYYSNFFNISYYYQNNQGVGKARNLGIEKAKGKYISFLDADDSYDSFFLSEMYEEIKLSNANICYCGYKQVSPEGSNKVSTKFTNKKLLVNYIIGKSKIHTDSWLIEKKFIEDKNIWFYEKMNWGEDFYFFCKLLYNSPSISYVNKNLTNYYIGFDKNRLSAFDISMLDKDIKIVSEIINDLNLSSNSDVYRALVNYRLPTLLLSKLTLLLKNDLVEYQDMEVLKFKYNKYYKKSSFRYGLPSFKQFVWRFRYMIIFKIKRWANE